MDTMGRQSARNKLKGRLYFCQACEARHTAPTGIKCTWTADHRSNDERGESQKEGRARNSTQTGKQKE